MPQADQLALDALADVVLDTISLRRIFLLLTQVHYSDPKNYGPMEATLGKFVWNKDPQLSKLFINLDYVFNPTKTDQFPGIFVGVGDISFRQQVLDNKVGYTPDRAGSENTILGSAPIILRHASLTPDEALALGSLSFNYYSGIRDFLMTRMKLTAFSLDRLSTPRFFNIDGTEKADKHYCSDLNMTITFDASWVTFTQSHRIKKITLGQLMTEFSQASE